MVYIKLDKEGRKVKEDPKSEIGYWGAKSDAEEISMFELMRLLVKRDYMGVHEVLKGDKYRPYADVDCSSGITEANFKERHLEILKSSWKIMELAFPDAEIHCWCSSGEKEDGSWKVSFHYVGIGVYFSEKAHIRFMLRDAPDMFDRAVYDKDHLMRLPYCTKPGSKRRLRKIELKTMGRAKEQFLRYYDEPEEHLIADGLVTNVGEFETELPAPEDYKEPARNVAINAEGDEGVVDEKWATWTFEKAKAVIARLKDDRADTHKKRIDGLFSILHLGRSINRVRKFRELAHEFAKKDSDYSEDKTNQDWDYCKLRKSDKPRTFACIIKDANEDSPQHAVVEVADDDEIPLTNYDERYKLLATKPGLPEVQRWIMGCIRYCDRGGKEQWYQHSTDGWWLIDNVKNMPFGSGSANSKFGDTTFLEIMTELKDSEQFNKRCRIAGSEFWPFYEEAPRTDIINTFNGWPFKARQSEVTKYVEFFRDYILGLFGKEPGEYVLNTLTKKLRFPRWKGALIIGFGRFGGEGKNATEALLTGLFGKRYVLSCIGTKHILGQGDAGFNPMIEDKLLAFVQEAGSKGKSIADEEAFKSWLSEDTQALRKMRENPRIIANMVLCFMWTNNYNCVNMTGPMARRTMAQRMNDQYMENTELFDEVWAVSRNDVALQEIFDWLINRDISSFVSTDIPDTDFKNQMKEESMTPIQRYVVEMCNGDRPGIAADKDGSITYPYAEMYQDFRSFCQTDGMTKIMQSETFKSELKNMDCMIKQTRYNAGGAKSRPICVIIDGPEMEKIMRKFLKDKEWQLLRADSDDEDELA